MTKNKSVARTDFDERVGRPVAKALGKFDGPLLICGGAYSNLEAFTAMLDLAARRNISASNIIHTGDIVAYCADPVATALALRQSGIHAIKGNVEEQLAGDAGHCGCGFDEGSQCSVLAREWYAFARVSMPPDLCRWMGTLPDALNFTLAGSQFRVIHGGVTDVSRFIFGSQSDKTFTAEFDLAGVDGIISGHSGMPFTRAVGQRIWHNSGALGMPANDGTPRVWVSIITPNQTGVHFEHIALDYDHRTAAAKMRDLKLPEGYAGALTSGLWPSLDVLPANERTQAGIALNVPPHRWRHSAPVGAPLTEPVVSL